MKLFAVLATFTSAVGACSTPLPPTYTAADVVTSNFTYTTAAALPITSIANMPNSSIGRFAGTLQGDVSSTGTIIGDLAMDVNFSSGQITGNATSINLLDTNKPSRNQTLRGSLDISGVVIANGMTATATGRLTGSYFGFSGSANFNLGLAGSFRTQSAPADTIAGTANGTGTGDVAVVVSNGSFSAQR